jgi:hypothetical protein
LASKPFEEVRMPKTPISEHPLAGLTIWNAGDDPGPIPPRSHLAGLITHAATNLTMRPLYRDNRQVRCRGQKLGKIIWQGRQWAVTSDGLECRDGTYAIEKDRLWEDEKDWGWVNHMAEKNWIDIIDFAEALRIARGHHAPHRPT